LQNAENDREMQGCFLKNCWKQKQTCEKSKKKQEKSLSFSPERLDF